MISTAILHKPEVIKQMREDLRPYIEARNTALYLNLDRRVYLDELEKEVRKVYEGLDKPVNGSLFPVCDRIFDLIRERFKALTVGEFSLACTNLIMGDYGLVKMINVNLFGNAVKEFNLSTKRMEAFKEYFSLEGRFGQEIKISEQESLKIVLEGVLNSFKEYKTEKILTLPPKLVEIHYDMLKSKGLVKWSEGQKAEMAKVAEEKLGRIKKGSVSVDLTAGIFGSETPVTIRKRVALTRYFDSLIESKTELETLLNPPK